MDLSKSVWEFTYIERMGVVLDRFYYLTRESRRHKFKSEKYWTRLSENRNSNITRPRIPTHVANKALEDIRNQVVFKDGELF